MLDLATLVAPDITSRIFTSIVIEVVVKKGFPYCVKRFEDVIKDRSIIDLIKNRLAGQWDQETMESIKDKFDFKAKNDPAFAQSIQNISIDHKKNQESILSESIKRNDEITETNALIELGKIYLSYGYDDKAEKMFEDAISILKNRGDKLRESIALGNIGLSYQMQKNYDRSQINYQGAIRTLDDLIASGSREFEDNAENTKANVLYNLGNVFFRKNDFERALTSFDEARMIFQNSNDQCGESRSLINAAMACEKLNLNERALLNYEQSLKNIGPDNKYLQDLARLNKSILLARLNRLNEAYSLFESILYSIRDCDEEDIAKPLHLNMGIVSMRLGWFEKSEPSFLECLRLRKDLKDNPDDAKALANLGYIYLNQKKYPKAIEVYENALVIFKAIESHDDECTLLYNLGIAYYNLWCAERKDNQLSMAKNCWNEAMPWLPPDSEKRRQIESWLLAL
jgi:tetratricopeptide (TPR) repeat protein